MKNKMKNNFFIAAVIILTSQLVSCQRYAFVEKETTHSEFSFQGENRSYLVHTPKNYDSSKTYPVIFVLHGITSRSKAIAGFSGFNAQSDKKDFIVCYPQGYKRSWAIQIPVGAAVRNDIDDVAFIDALIDTLSSNYSVDTSKIFACGISNGGFMSALIASKLPNHFSGIALVCSNLFNPLEDYNSTDTIPLLLIGSTKDPLLQFEGGKVKTEKKYSTSGFSSTIDYWVKKNDCHYPIDSLIIENDPKDKTTVIKYFSKDEVPENRVVLYKVVNGGHAWAGRKKDFKSIFLGKITNEINAAEVISDFFLDIQ